MTIKIKPNYDTDFLTFWYVYPNKVAKFSAKKAWDKAVQIAQPCSIIAGVHVYIERKPYSQAYCHAATWLNGRRWQDDYTPTKTTPKIDRSKIPSRETVYRYAKDKNDLQGYAVSFYNFWGSRNFMENGCQIDWQIRLGEDLAKRRRG